MITRDVRTPARHANTNLLPHRVVTMWCMYGIGKHRYFDLGPPPEFGRIYYSSDFELDSDKLGHNLTCLDDRDRQKAFNVSPVPHFGYSLSKKMSSLTASNISCFDKYG